ncbi:carbamate kinase [Clostridium gelidum]|uniref:Carbamate kinase n=1 Tax=Clostridium gelidum TaxID=704125 RepID=A0ABM7T671_9CLOT|nr:carbamate kinase [Clostridium gelidum]
MSKIVIALGGNALGKTLEEQMESVKITSKSIVDLIESGNQVVVTHGNGPQVGMINSEMDQMPLTICVAMSQGYIGYDLQNAIREEVLSRNLKIPVVTLITQTLVDPNDSAFLNPTKPIGRFYSKEEAEELEKTGLIMKEDFGRGYRQVVSSPKPIDIIEKKTILELISAGEIVIACGGGGIPVIQTENNHLKGVPAVIDKDFVAALLAKEIEADCLIILTAVEKVAVNFGKPDVEWLDSLTIEKAKKYIEEGQFAPGSMLPKVQAALEFVSSGKERTAIITLLDKVHEGILGKTGTHFKM